MKALPHPAMRWLLLIILTSCTSSPRPTDSLKLTETAPAQAVQPTEVVIAADLAFSTPLVQLLSRSGLSILSVQSSAYMSMFQSADNAAWIKTDEGIVEAVSFADLAEVRQIHITQQSDGATGRYLYTIQAPPPTLLHDLTIDAAFPLYFTLERGMFMVTSSAELDKTLKHIFLEQ